MDDNIYAAPKAPLDAMLDDDPFRPDFRGVWLSAFLLISMVANGANCIMFVKSFLQGTMYGHPLAPLWAFALLSMGAAVNVAACVGMWRWRRWGVYYFFGIAIIASGVNTAIGVPAASVGIGLLSAVILVVLIRPIWRYMR